MGPFEGSYDEQFDSAHYKLRTALRTVPWVQKSLGIPVAGVEIKGRPQGGMENAQATGYQPWSAASKGGR